MTDRPDWSPTAVDVVLRPEWATLEAVDKNLTAQNLAAAYNESADVVYVVPAGKTLIITQVSFACVAAAAANGDLPQIGGIILRDDTDGVNRFVRGGNGGGGYVMSKPEAFVAGHTCKATVKSFANHACIIYVQAAGYEI